MKNEKYFEQLRIYAQGLLNRLPIKLDVQPLEYAVVFLKNEIDCIKLSEIDKLNQLWIDEPIKVTTLNRAIGLNTIGLLIDRFTILIIKEWCLQNKNGDSTKANQLYTTQIKEIITALVDSMPGNSSINSKITNIKTTVEANTWEHAFYGLLTVNLILWESQEILYIKDIATLPVEELRGYINWFAQGNMQRNVLIELCEIRYWKKMESHLQ